MSGLTTIPTKVLEASENEAKVVDMFFLALASNKDVIDIDIGEIQAMKNVVNETLECLSSIAETKWNSNRPNGVVMAVLWMSTGIWCKARTRSSLEKMVEPWRVVEKSWMWGTG